jgi:membrane protease YdiL (CAAX protease family)
VSRAAIAIAACALAVALGVALARVSSLERRELDAGGEWRRPSEAEAGRLRLIEARLFEGDDVTMELCTGDAMDPARWSGAAAIAVVRADTGEEMFSRAIEGDLLDRARRSERGSCVDFAHAQRFEAGGEAAVPAAIELVPNGSSAIADVPVRARLMGRRPLGNLDLAIVLGSLAAALALVIAGAMRAPSAVADGAPLGWLRALAALALVASTMWLLAGLAPHGPTAGLVGGLALALIEVGIAYLLVRPAPSFDRTAALGLVRPERRNAAAAWLIGAPFAGLALFFLARIALSLVPSTGEAPVETFVSWPSGMLSFAALAVAAPIAEEVFFRGLLFGVLRGAGGVGRTALAIAGAWVPFALAHAAQGWGNWGGLLSVLVAGLGFTLLRAASGSTLVPCVAHLVYNGLLAAGALVEGAR